MSAPGHCHLCQDVCLEASTLRAVSRLMSWANDEPPAEGLKGQGGGEEKLAGGVLRHKCPSNWAEWSISHPVTTVGQEYLREVCHHL